VPCVPQACVHDGIGTRLCAKEKKHLCACQRCAYAHIPVGRVRDDHTCLCTVRQDDVGGSGLTRTPMRRVQGIVQASRSRTHRTQCRSTDGCR
jgi:hypothetical protein